MGQILNHSAFWPISTITVPLLWIFWNTGPKEQKHRRPRFHRASKLWRAKMYLKHDGKTLRLEFGGKNRLVKEIPRCYVPWLKKIEGVMWHDVIVDIQFWQIIAITRDSVGKRHAIVKDFFPSVVTELILSYMYKPLRARQKREWSG
jgi:hypothetical protein